MLKCWEANRKTRVCFKEIVDELAKEIDESFNNKC